MLRAAAEAVAAFAEGGYFTVAEGILYPFMLDLFAAACAPYGIVLHYAVLRAPIGTVQRRVQDRTAEPPHAGALADAAVVDDLWTQFESHGVEERHRVDCGAHRPDGGGRGDRPADAGRRAPPLGPGTTSGVDGPPGRQLLTCRRRRGAAWS